jgi:hypothetical protein
MSRPLTQDQIEYQHVQDLQPVVVRCMFCPDWNVEAPAGEAREIASSHREQAHPEIRVERKAATGPLRQCKIGSCPEPAVQNYGRYGGLCEQHKADRKGDELNRESAKRGNANAAALKLAGRDG